MSEHEYIEMASGWRSTETYTSRMEAAQAALDRQASEGVPFEAIQLAEADAFAIFTRYRPGSRRPGRPRIHQEPRQDVRVSLPVDLIAAIDAAAPNRTAFIERAIRAALASQDATIE